MYTSPDVVAFVIIIITFFNFHRWYINFMLMTSPFRAYNLNNLNLHSNFINIKMIYEIFKSVTLLLPPYKRQNKRVKEISTKKSIIQNFSYLYLASHSLQYIANNSIKYISFSDTQ